MVRYLANNNCVFETGPMSSAQARWPIKGSLITRPSSFLLQILTQSKNILITMSGWEVSSKKAADDILTIIIVFSIVMIIEYTECILYSAVKC